MAAEPSTRGVSLSVSATAQRQRGPSATALPQRTQVVSTSGGAGASMRFDGDLIEAAQAGGKLLGEGTKFGKAVFGSGGGRGSGGGGGGGSSGGAGSSGGGDSGEVRALR